MVKSNDNTYIPLGGPSKFRPFWSLLTLRLIASHYADMLEKRMRSFLLTTVTVLIAATGMNGCASAGLTDGEKAELNSARQNASKAYDNGLTKVSDVSPSARATRPEQVPEYADARAMLENADMSAFMEESRRLHEKGERSDSWGFAAIDMLAAGEDKAMLALIDAMPIGDTPDRALSRSWLRPWGLAAAGRNEDAVRAMKRLRDDLPPILYRGHMALLQEAIGEYDEALDTYSLTSEELTLPDIDADPSESSILQSLAFGKYRILAFREANLKRLQGDDKGARKIYDMLLEADEDDYYATSQIDDIAKGEKPEDDELNINEALALALNDEANLIEERQALAAVIFAQSAEAPFNHFVSALRQSALVLDPSNSGVREIEAGHLYDHGFFEASARVALSGKARSEERAELMLSAAQAYVELGKFERVSALVEEVLEIDGGDGMTLLSASDLMIRADQGARAAELAAKARQTDIQDGLIGYTHVIESEAHFQAGDVEAAIASARNAVELDDDDDGMKEFLASQLLNSDATRQEGLDIYKELFKDDPDDPGMMNNYGYSLIKAPDTPDQLDEGYRLLKRANRLTPFEPNLLDSLGWAYYQYGDFDQALELIDKAVAAYAPFTHWELYEHRGDTLFRLGREDEARGAWQNAVDARPPRHRRSAIEAKIQTGMAVPPPEKRTPPLVRRSEPVETNDI
ncbi:MAG: hypothetical protein CME88_15745 [Hirschia sp.]|nr:hypothetical protein [Hirschia sp.]MBF19832.1 hypothetical protein [Hirschia sp.]